MTTSNIKNNKSGGRKCNMIGYNIECVDLGADLIRFDLVLHPSKPVPMQCLMQITDQGSHDVLDLVYGPPHSIHI